LLFEVVVVETDSNIGGIGVDIDGLGIGGEAFTGVFADDNITGTDGGC
jgi:hypothetical protein